MISVAWSTEGPMLANHTIRALSMVPVERSICQVTTINLTKASDNPDRAREPMTDGLGPELQQAMVEHVTYSPVDPARKLDAAAPARTALWRPMLARGMELNSAAVAVLVDRMCHKWRDRSLIDR